MSGNGAGRRWGAGQHGADQLRQGAPGDDELHAVFGFLQDADGLLMCDRLVECLSIDGKDLISFLQSSISIKNEKGGKKISYGSQDRHSFSGIQYQITLILFSDVHD